MFSTTLIKTYIVVFISVHTYALHKSDEVVNVGTVLFAPSDLAKERWNRESIELLEARTHFQNILPSPSSIDTLNEDYIKDLISYFSKAFSTVKREASDPELEELMEKALTDTVGGFFKVWVLPVTKFAYYGGTVSEENAMKAFQYYEDLKNNLHTDGTGWRIPNYGILDTIAISVIPFSHIPHTRSMKEPCEHIAYYEIYNNSLSFAIPYINWNENPSSMFLPLKNESSVLLDSLSSSKSLLKYYDIAQRCCHSNGVEGCNEFDSKFQDWLSDDVVPHLNDEKLYFAFGGVLGLLNNTKELYEKIADSCIQENDRSEQKSIFTNFLPNMSSRKFQILVLVLFLEIIWCIPSLLYLLCCRKRQNMRKRTQYFVDIFKRRKCNTYDFQTIERVNEREEKYNFKDAYYDSRGFVKISQPRMKDNSSKVFQQPLTHNIEVETQYPSHTSKRSTGQVTESFPDFVNTKLSESLTVINEIPQKSSSEKPVNHTSSLIQATPNLCIGIDMERTSQTESFATVQKVETIKPNLDKNRSGKSSKSCINNLISYNSGVRVSSEVKQMLKDLDKQAETKEICPCSCCSDNDKKIIDTAIKKNKKMDLKRFKTNFAKKNFNVHLENSPQSNKEASCSKTIKLTKPQTKCFMQKEIRLNKTKDPKLNTGEPHLEKRINRPAMEITVDITKCSESSRKNAKPSKIPRRSPIRNVIDNRKQEKLNAVKTTNDSCVFTQVVYKAKVDKRAVDDLLLQRKTFKRNKLNETF